MVKPTLEQFKDATSFTRDIHEEYLKYLNFEDKQDFEDAKRGLIAPFENSIRDLNSLESDSPETVNPSLWRNSQLQAMAGLYEVVEGVYQVRGLSLATTIFVEGQTGVIVMDTSSGNPTAKAAIELYYQYRPKKPVTAIIISQSHSDHFGGTQAILEYAEHPDIPIIVPNHFMKEMFSENILLGPTMKRRANYQFGLNLPIGEKGYINAGIGSVFGEGNAQSGYAMPNKEIKDEFQEVKIDNIIFQFLLTPNTEAPAEMHVYIQDYKILFASENANKTMHQLYTIRGAKTRDTMKWVEALDKTIDLFKEKEIHALVMAHSWPIWGKERALTHLHLQRDLYKYIHDQTVRLANHGYTMDEIAEMLKLPNSLGKYWGNREYYGTVKHNSKGVYNFYLGYYSGHPSDLDALPQVESGQKYVQYMGGVANVIQQAKADYDKGEYRWVAQVLKHVVMADPTNKEAKELMADAYEQLGYQSESANWRNTYLLGALELRNGYTKKNRPSKNIPEMILSMPFDEFFKLLAVRLNGPKADGKKIIMNASLIDVKESYAIYLDNAVINKKNGADDNPDVSLTTDKYTFYAIFFGGLELEQKVIKDRLEVSGHYNKLKELLTVLDNFDSKINIVTP